MQRTVFDWEEPHWPYRGLSALLLAAPQLLLLPPSSALSLLTSPPTFLNLSHFHLSSQTSPFQPQTSNLSPSHITLPHTTTNRSRDGAPSPDRGTGLGPRRPNGSNRLEQPPSGNPASNGFLHWHAERCQVHLLGLCRRERPTLTRAHSATAQSGVVACGPDQGRGGRSSGFTPRGSTGSRPTPEVGGPLEVLRRLRVVLPGVLEPLATRRSALR